MLDRGIYGHSWCMASPEAIMEHLVYSYSNHNHPLLQCSNSMFIRLDKRKDGVLSHCCTMSQQTPLFFLTMIYLVIFMVERRKLKHFQKSHEKWIKLGSKNTSFFIAQTFIRKKRNKMHELYLPTKSRVEGDVWHFVQETFLTCSFDPKVTKAIIVLIPNGETLTCFKGFCLISLCKVIYKTKNNVIMLQEVVHHMKNSIKKKEDIIFKLDLEKAYD
ncbi:hypothetical protein CR513_16471, partial [Mucuna pruriens]